MGPVGVPEMFAIFVIALLLFGPKKLPELGRTLGKALSEFRRAKNELKGTFESHLRELERETQIPTPYTHDYSSGYNYPSDDYNHNSELPVYSAPSRIGGTQDHPALPSSTGDIAAAEQYVREQPATPSWPPVIGTVARANGIRPLDESTEPTGEEQRVPLREEHPA